MLYSLTVQLPMRPTHVSATHLSVHDSSVALHLMRIACVDVAAMCMLLGNVGYAQPNTAHQHQQAAKFHCPLSPLRQLRFFLGRFISPFACLETEGFSARIRLHAVILMIF